MSIGWTLADLERLLVEVEVERGPRRARRAREQADPSCELTTLHVDLDRLPPLLRSYVRQRPGEHRGRQFFSLVLACIEHGLPAGAALYLCSLHAPTTGKYGAPPATGTWAVADQVVKVYADHDHLEATCWESGCPNIAGTTADVEEMRRVYIALMCSPWPLAQRNLRDLLAGVLMRGIKEGSPKVAVSIRDMAVEGGMHENTAWKWKKIAVELGALHLAGTPRGLRSQSYCLQLDTLVTLIPSRAGGYQANRRITVGQGRGLSVTTLSALADLARPNKWHGHLGLGKTAVSLWFLLLDGKQTKPELAETLGAKTTRTIERALDKLAEYGAVENRDGRWIAREDVDWVGVALQRGVLGRVDHQRAEIALDRALHALALEESERREDEAMERIRAWMARSGGLDRYL